MKFQVGDLVIAKQKETRYSVTNNCTVCMVVESYENEAQGFGYTELESGHRRYNGFGDIVVEVMFGLTERERLRRGCYKDIFFDCEVGNQFVVSSKRFDLFLDDSDSVPQVELMGPVSFEEVFS